MPLTSPDRTSTITTTTSAAFTRGQLTFDWHDRLSAEHLQHLIDEIDSPTVWLPQFLAATSPKDHQFIAFVVREGAVIKAINIGSYRGQTARHQLYFPTVARCYDKCEQALTLLNDSIRLFCRSKGMVKVTQNSFEASKNYQPRHELVAFSQLRSEYFIDLTPCLDTIFNHFSTSHKRNIKKAQKRQLQVKLSTSPAALTDHFLACGETAKRRLARHESVPSVNKPLIKTLLLSGHAFILQLYDQTQIICSIFIVTTKQRAFYFSGGTTPQGTKMGAFHYLLWLTMTELKSRSITSLSLGGTDQHSPAGLIRFKLGFNAQKIELTHYRLLSGQPVICRGFWIMQTWLTRIKASLSKAYYVLLRFFNKLIQVQTWDLFYTDKPFRQTSFEKFELRKLNRDDYQIMLNAGGRLTTQAQLYYVERGIETAYGVFDGDKLAHVSWVYGAEEYAKEPHTLLKLQTGQVELTNAYSNSDFRGQGVFRFTLQRLSKDLFEQGVSRIYGKVVPGNQASYKAIIAVGYQPCGKVRLITGYLIPWRRGIYIGQDNAPTIE